MADFVLAVDLGTTHIKAALVDERGRLAPVAREPAPPVSADGSFDADAYFRATHKALQVAVVAAPADASVTAIACSSQRATFVPVDSEGVAIGPGHSWIACSAPDVAVRFFEDFGPERFLDITGLPPSHMFSAGRLAAMAETDPDIFTEARRFALLGDFILRQLGAEELTTDPSNAWATGIADLGSGTWSLEICDALGMDPAALPKIGRNGTTVGELSRGRAAEIGIEPGTPLVLGGGDQQCALLGSGATSEGDLTLSLGTAAALLAPVDSLPRPAVDSGTLFGIHAVPGQWEIEGFTNAFGAALDGARRILGFADVDELLSEAAKAAPGAGGVTYAPFLIGIGTPDFDDACRGAFFGFGLESSRADLSRAAIEGIACEVRRALEAVASHVQLRNVRVVGGAGGGLVVETLASILDRKLDICRESETALLGAAALGWSGTGRFDNLRVAVTAIGSRLGEQVEPDAAAAARHAKIYERYRAAVGAVRIFHEEKTQGVA